jgi:hypothetical protein
MPGHPHETRCAPLWRSSTSLYEVYGRVSLTQAKKLVFLLGKRLALLLKAEADIPREEGRLLLEEKPGSS